MSYYRSVILCFAGYHHPHCTEIDTLQAELEQMQSNNINGQCGPPNGSLHGTMNHSTGTNRSNRSRRSSRIGGPGQDSIDIIDPSKEKTVNFANCVSPPSPHDPGFMGINNESYPCDCCQIDEAAFRRSYSTQMPCGPSGMMQFSEVSSFDSLSTDQRHSSSLHFFPRDFLPDLTFGFLKAVKPRQSSLGLQIHSLSHTRLEVTLGFKAESLKMKVKAISISRGM